MSTTRESVNGKGSSPSIANAGRPLLALSLTKQGSERPAKLLAGARAAYSSLMNDLADYDHATPKLQAIEGNRRPPQPRVRSGACARARDDDANVPAPPLCVGKA